MKLQLSLSAHLACALAPEKQRACLAALVWRFFRAASGGPCVRVERIAPKAIRIYDNEATAIVSSPTENEIAIEEWEVFERPFRSAKEYPLLASLKAPAVEFNTSVRASFARGAGWTARGREHVIDALCTIDEGIERWSARQLGATRFELIDPVYSRLRMVVSVTDVNQLCVESIEPVSVGCLGVA